MSIEEAIPSDDVRQHWNLSIIKEYLKRILMAISGGDPARGPPDYAQDVANRVAREITRQYGRWHVEFNNGDAPPPNSEKRLLAWILGILAALLVAGVTGCILMYGESTSLKATVTEWKASIDRRLDQNDRRMERLENRP